MKKYTEKDIKEGMKLRCTDNNGYVRWTTGGMYEVKKTDEGVLYIEDVEGGCRSYIDAILFRLNHNDESAIFEVIEEKPVRFAKVTCVYPPDRGLIEVGHCYKVLKEFPEGRVRIYLNSKLGNHVLLPDQFVFVDEPSNDGEKDVEELDVEAKILADIEQLKTEAECLFAKRDRVNEQALNLNAKARKLEESLEVLREYM
ncbi:putative cytidine deaminase [Enterococcus phage EF24C]|uniref:Putative cytidine deaminase n=1 Tax=Enterococcus phage phiEF24C TaxID=442493 RepID=A8E2F5_BPPHE|nr:putative cytidine deaminase [Enterococcus phage EF24C]BAF81371.1 putative cytidine deaminase [Enterococcus phage EF24C]